MAIYVFRCVQCGYIDEKQLPMDHDEAQVSPCPECGHEQSTRVIVCPAVRYDWHLCGPNEGPLDTVKTRFRRSAVPASIGRL